MLGVRVSKNTVQFLQSFGSREARKKMLKAVGEDCAREVFPLCEKSASEVFLCDAASYSGGGTLQATTKTKEHFALAHSLFSSRSQHEKCCSGDAASSEICAVASSSRSRAAQPMDWSNLGAERPHAPRGCKQSTGLPPCCAGARVRQTARHEQHGLAARRRRRRACSYRARPSRGAPSPSAPARFSQVSRRPCMSAMRR